MGFKLIPLDVPEPAKIPLKIGAHTIGRGSFLGCQDHRVSRQHASLDVKDDMVILKSLHQNPCFYNKANITKSTILPEGQCVSLSNGDHFGLLQDKNWYELILCDEDTSTDSTIPSQEDRGNEKTADKSRDRNTTEISDDINSDTQSNNLPVEDENDEDLSNLKLEFDEAMAEGDGNESQSLISSDNPVTGVPIAVITPDDPNTSLPPKEDSQTEHDETHGNHQITPNKRPHTPDPSDNAKKVKTQPESSEKAEDPTKEPLDPNKSTDKDQPSPMDVNHDSANDTEGTTDTESDKPSVYDVKKEPQSPNDAKNVKKEPESPKDDKKDPDLAKPGSSHDQPGSSNANDNGPPKPPNKPARERCIYGANCYRKNAQHKMEFSHPCDGDYGAGPRGVCPYGASCRRGDPRHWVVHEHPPGTAPPAPRPPRAQHDQRQGNPAKKPRRVVRQSSESENSDAHSPSPDLILHGKRKRKAVKRDTWSDSEELEDPYGTDESDEWEPPSDVTTSQSQSQGY